MEEEMTERIYQRTGGARRVVISMFFAGCLAVAGANAAIITVMSTEATAAGGSAFGVSDPLFASDSQSFQFASGSAVADVLSGHLGAFASSVNNAPLNGPVEAFILMNLAIDDAQPTDFIEIDMSLNGSYTPGGGGRVDLTETDPIVQVLASIGCNSFNDRFHGVSCWAGVGPGDPGHAGNAVQVFIPLDGLDSLSLTWFLTLGLSSSPGSQVSDFLHSADFSILVPSGTTIVNNPGGDLFQTPGQAAPEPGGMLLLGSGLVLAWPVRRYIA
jgi:hypothetical protein